MKLVHRAKLIRGDGGVSALCFAQPRKIDLGRATWTNRDEAVTCRRCLALMEFIAAAKAEAKRTEPKSAVEGDEPEPTR